MPVYFFNLPQDCANVSSVSMILAVGTVFLTPLSQGRCTPINAFSIIIKTEKNKVSGDSLIQEILVSSVCE